MNKKGIQKAWKWLQWIVLIYLLIGIALYFFQNLFLFHPRKLAADYRYQFTIPFRQIDLAVTEKKNLSIVQFTVPDSIRKGIVLFFHGNRQHIGRYAGYAPYFTSQGYEVWMMDYPGFGKSIGPRTEKILYEDALLLYKMAQAREPLEHIIIYGKSLGTGIAAQLASVRGCKRLILETPYYSIAALARHYFFMYPVLTKYELPTYKYFEYINAPISIFHGTRDRTIPYQQAQWLAELKPGTELITIEKGRHNNLAEFPLFREKLDSLLTH